jgi:predicted AlkP superfamily phosphohydrolase/phosphomutase
MEKPLLKISLKVGLAAGMVVGVVETLVILSGSNKIAEISRLPLYEIITWSMIGLFLAFVTRFFTTRTNPEAISIISLRIFLLLFTLELAFQLNSRLFGLSLNLKSLLVNIIIISVALSLFILSASIIRIRFLKKLFSKLARIWYVPTLIAIILSTGLTVWIYAARSFEIETLKDSPITETAEFAKPPKVMVIGYDSAMWSILIPIIEEGKLPNLQRLMQSGRWGILKSYEISESPVVWTSIMTGKSPDSHRIHTFSVAIATNRRVKTLWEIATEAGSNCVVINVPGTFPTLEDCDVMLAGFPFPSPFSSNRGWIATTGDSPSKEVMPSLPLGFILSEMEPDFEEMSVLKLKAVPRFIPRSNITPVILIKILRRLNASLAKNLQTFLFSIDLMKIKLSMRNDSAEADNILMILRADGKRLFELKRGDWSPWLKTKIYNTDHIFQMHYINTGRNEISLYITPPFPDEQIVQLPDELQSFIEKPYIAEGAGWQIFLEERLIEPLRDHLMNIASRRYKAGKSILDNYKSDLFIFIFTVTDRIQHPFLKFKYPQRFLDLAVKEGGKYEEFKPTQDQITKFGSVIEETYIQLDEWLGNMLERAGPDTWIILLSDHGSATGKALSPTAGIHHTDGIYVIAKPPLEIEKKLETKTLYETKSPDLALEDITPVVLHLLDLPVALDMKGKVPDFLLPIAGTELKFVKSYETSILEEVKPEEEIDEATKEQLRSLGYIE